MGTRKKRVNAKNFKGSPELPHKAGHEFVYFVIKIDSHASFQ